MEVGKNRAGETVMYGKCRYCGQIMDVTFACEEGATDAEMNRQATLHCTCEGAKLYAAIEAAKVRAIRVINETVGNEEIRDAMQVLVSPACEQAVKNITIDNGNGTKYAMQLNKGLVEVKVTKTSVETQS